MKLMKAARLHSVGSPMQIDQIPIPEPASNDVQVRVRSCGIVPNLGNVLANWGVWFPDLPLPPLPAIFGLDPAGEISAVGSHVLDWKVGDRVYVNPGRVCGGCIECRSNNAINCSYFAFSGYFGGSKKSLKIFENYPSGGLCEYMLAPQYALVKLPDNVSYDEAARLGYLGTMFSALLKGAVGPGRTVLINGISGTLGIGGALLSLAMGAQRILGTGRNRELLDRVKALAPDRIDIHVLGDEVAVDAWARSLVDGGMDVYIDALAPGAPVELMQQGLAALKRGGRAYNIGGVSGPVGIEVSKLMANGQRVEGSGWFTSGEGQQMVAMAASGILDFSVFEHVRYPLDRVNEAISGMSGRDGGFSNYVVNP